MKTTKLVMFMALTFSTAVLAREIPWKTYSSDKLICGDATIRTESVCQDPYDGVGGWGSGGIVRQCRSAKITITRHAQNTVIDLPHVPAEQRQRLEAQGYNFSGMMEEGQWSPFLLMCVTTKEPLLVMSYITSGNNQLENHSTDSLAKNPVVIDLDGRFVDEETNKNVYLSLEKEKRYKIPRLDINGVYGDETKEHTAREY